ncbi:hypothetical protein ACFX19_041918 [Malus domestica]
MSSQIKAPTPNTRAYRTLQDRGPYPANQVVKDREISFAFVVYDSKGGNPMNLWLAKPSYSLTSMGGHGSGERRRIGLGRLRVATDGSPSTDAASGSTLRFRMSVLIPKESRACRLLHHLCFSRDGHK